MDAEEFRKRGKEMIDFVADYLENIRERKVYPDVQPGYLQKLIPSEAPEEPEKWDDVYKDIERVIMPGVTHWHSPQFHAYYPTASSYAAICGDILSDGIGCLGFSWATSPVCTELEVAMLDWLGKILQLPEEFMSGGKGGGVIQGTASESTLVTLLAAKRKKMSEIKEENNGIEEKDINDKLVAYCSDQSHSSVERACLMGSVRCTKVDSDSNERMCGDALAAAIAKDRENGLIPFFAVATLGTTPTCAFDKLLEIGPVCNQENIWLHIDAAYAGSAFICPEYRPLLDGVEFADSFNFNPHKWMMVNFDCSTLWFKDRTHIDGTIKDNPLYLKHENQGTLPDYRHWQIPFGRRFRSLKLWFVMRMYGTKKLQEHIRKDIRLAKEFEEKVKLDNKFEVTHPASMGLVCFKIKGSNELNEILLRKINEDGRIHLVPSKSKGIYFLRFAVCATRTESKDIEFAWVAISDVATKVVAKNLAKGE